MRQPRLASLTSLRTISPEPRRLPQRRVSSAMYAVSFDLDAEALQVYYPNQNWQLAQVDVTAFLKNHGFDHRKGNVFFGSQDIDSVRCQIVIQKLTLKYDWFAPSVRDIRMLRITDDNDLMPAVEFAARMRERT